MTDEIDLLRAENVVLRDTLAEVTAALGAMMRMADDTMPMLNAIADVAIALNDQDLAEKARALFTIWEVNTAPLRSAVQMSVLSNAPTTISKN